MCIISHEKEEQSMFKKELFIVGAAIVILMAVVMFFPVTGTTDSLSVPVPPILDNIPPAWSQKLPGAQRFQLVLNDVAVLDKETGLVWEKQVNRTPDSWLGAMFLCNQLEKGGRWGWHLPTLQQLASLLDTSVEDTPKLPAGHPFTDVIASTYWTSTTHFQYSSLAYFVNFGDGGLSHDEKDGNRLIWCVRGGETYDGHPLPNN
jgi:hypothetical protein